MPQVHFLKLKKPTAQQLIEAAKKISPLLAGVFNKKDQIAIKLHFGERQSKTYLSPVFTKTIYQAVRPKVSRAALVDCTVLYKSERAFGESHKKLAKDQGFDFADIVIADGKAGEKEMLVEIEKGRHFNRVKIGGEMSSFNGLLCLTHFTGHSLTGFGGAIKNIGMGLGTKAGKLEMHQAFRLSIAKDLCTGCSQCQNECPSGAISLVSDTKRAAFGRPKKGPVKAEIDFSQCLGCGKCIAVCPFGAIQIPWSSASSTQVQERMAEYALGALKNKKACFCNVLLNITQRCDCVRETQEPFLEDIGILVSSDIVALDQASLDLAGKENFSRAGVNPQIQIDHAQRLGLGSKEYQLLPLSF